MKICNRVVRDLKSSASLEKKVALQRSFKTGIGQYGEGDIFLGVTVPDQRLVAKRYFRFADLESVERLLSSPVHEYRFTALLILVYLFSQCNLVKKRMIFDFYLSNIHMVNNWDLVDLSAPNIIGQYMLLTGLDFEKLRQLSTSPILWIRRISIVATLAFVRAVKKQQVNNNWLLPSIQLSQLLLSDSHDLIHKAVGWVLREVGKVDELLLIGFLDKYGDVMTRTTLRYSIERFAKSVRDDFLNKTK